MTNCIPINITYIRKKNYLSQKELGEKYNMTAASVSSYERGKSEPTLSFVLGFCDEFNINIDDFIKEDLSKLETMPDRVPEVEPVKVIASDPHYDRLLTAKNVVIETKDELIQSQKHHIQLLEKHVNMLEVLLNQNKNNT